MFKEMRRKDRLLDEQRTLEVLKTGQYGVLSTSGENGYAYGVPLNYTYMDGSIYFHCATEGNKLENINYNNKVSFCVIGETMPVPETFSYKYECVIVFGTASEALDQEKKAALVALIEKYSPEFLEKGMKYIEKDMNKTTVIKISIEQITGKSND